MGTIQTIPRGPSPVAQVGAIDWVSVVDALDAHGAAVVPALLSASQCRALIAHYMGNAKILREACENIGLKVFGGENAPYVWVRTPKGVSSWQLFDRMFNEINVVITPGAGFGAQGEGYIRISAFNSRENAEEVARRLKKL